MKIEILGVGCKKCDKAKKVVEEALLRQGVSGEVVKVSQLSKIMEYGVISTPAIVVNGIVKVSGKVPGVEDVIAWIR